MGYHRTQPYIIQVRSTSGEEAQQNKNWSVVQANTKLPIRIYMYLINSIYTNAFLYNVVDLFIFTFINMLSLQLVSEGAAI